MGAALYQIKRVSNQRFATAMYLMYLAVLRAWKLSWNLYVIKFALPLSLSLRPFVKHADRLRFNASGFPWIQRTTNPHHFRLILESVH